MPRCGCGATCSCLIVAGEGVQVDGIGTIENPYEISSDASELLERIEFVDTPSVDFTVTGIGTLITPMSVQAEATLALTDLTDVQGTPGNQQVPVWVDDHWEFQDQTGGGGGLSPSGTWDISPLDIYGTDDLIGREVYIDSNGQLRAKPDLVPTHLVADLGSTYPTGLSIFYLTAALSGPWPPAGATAATVVTTKSTSTTQYGVTQWCYSATAGTTRAWVRTGTNVAWNAWLEVATSAPAPRTLRRKSTSQALTTASTYYTITFDVDGANGTGIGYSGGVFTVPEAGVYLINPLVLVQGSGAPTIRVRIIAAGLNLGEETVIGGSGNNTFTQSRSIRLAAGETIYLEAQSTLTGFSVTGSTPAYTMIDITRISA